MYSTHYTVTPKKENTMNVRIDAQHEYQEGTLKDSLRVSLGVLVGVLLMASVTLVSIS